MAYGEDSVKTAAIRADEGGSWKVGVEWESVLPAWFRVLSATVGPAEYAQRNRYNSQVSLRARTHQDARRGAENCDPDVTPGFAETVSPGERSIDPFILFVVFLVCRYFSRCHGLVDSLSDFFVVGVGQVN